jgi:hypothetical protein
MTRVRKCVNIHDDDDDDDDDGYDCSKRAA